MKNVKRVIMTWEERAARIKNLRKFITQVLGMKEKRTCTFVIIEMRPELSLEIIEKFSELFNSYNFCHVTIYSGGIDLNRNLGECKVYTCSGNIRFGNAIPEVDDKIKPRYFEMLKVTINVEHSIIGLHFIKGDNIVGLDFRMDQ